MFENVIDAVLKLPNYLKTLGVGQGLYSFCRIYSSSWNENLFSLRVGLQTIWLRRTVSDVAIFFQIFVKREYATDQWEQHRSLMRRYNDILQSGKRPIVVDAGANVGLSALWFLQCFPLAVVYAVEPDRRNFDVLKLNSAQLRSIIPLQGAVWDVPAKLNIANPTAGASAFRIEEGDGGVATYCIPEIVAKEPNGQLFIVKVDIEGGEASLFRSNTDWIKDTDLIVVELHDWLFPGQGTSKNFLRAISDLDVDLLARGENFFCFRAHDRGLERVN